MNQELLTFIEGMTETEKSLLLFFETQAVDQGGRVFVRSMNDEDREIAKRWSAIDPFFVMFGRLSIKDCTEGRTHYVKFSERAYEVAAILRKQRAERNFVYR